eukprot:scaffold18474_cov107-Isochrysis_galbana.AAC.9
MWRAVVAGTMGKWGVGVNQNEQLNAPNPRKARKAAWRPGGWAVVVACRRDAYAIRRMYVLVGVRRAYCAAHAVRVVVRPVPSRCSAVGRGASLFGFW